MMFMLLTLFLMLSLFFVERARDYAAIVSWLFTSFIFISLSFSCLFFLFGLTEFWFDSVWLAASSFLAHYLTRATIVAVSSVLTEIFFFSLLFFSFSRDVYVYYYC